MPILHVEQLLEFFLADVAPADEIASEKFLGVVRSRGDDPPLVEVELLLEPDTIDCQGPRLSALRDPLKQVGEGHRFEIAADRHARRLTPPPHEHSADQNGAAVFSVEIGVGAGITSGGLTDSRALQMFRCHVR